MYSVFVFYKVVATIQEASVILAEELTILESKNIKNMVIVLFF